jgi:hypothetical protein
MTASTRVATGFTDGPRRITPHSIEKSRDQRVMFADPMGTPQFASVKGGVGASRFLFHHRPAGQSDHSTPGFFGAVDFPLGGYEPRSALCVSKS